MTREHYGLTMDKSLFAALISELARRGHGEREAGAFLLTSSARDPDRCQRQHVTALVYYDDLDPHCLTGGITFTADGYTSLATRCRRDGLRVAADIHTHPGRSVAQSHTDAAHPMSALPGHVALIAPRYAQGVTNAAQLGVHILRDSGQWTSLYDRYAARFVRLTSHRRFLTDPVSAAALCLHRLIRGRRPQ